MFRVKSSSLNTILKFYKKYMWLYVGFIIILIIKAIISFFSAMLVANIITNLMNLNFNVVYKLNYINIIILLIFHLLSYLNTFFYKNLENKVRYDIQQTILINLLNMKMEYYDKVESGVILTRITSDIDLISEKFKVITENIINSIRRIMYLFYIYLLNFKLGICITIFVIIISIIYTVRIKYLSKLKPIVKNKKEIVNSKIIEIIRAVKDIKTLNCDKNILKYISDFQNDFIKKDNEEYYVGNGLCKMTDFFVDFSDYLFIILCCKFIKNYQLTLSVFYTCYLYKDHTFTFAKEFGDLRYELVECKICADRLYQYLSPNLENNDLFGKIKLLKYEGDIEFDNVCFSYIKGINILKNISFNIKPKSTVAIVGESGSGKSSIANLIGHLYYKSSGNIKFNNIDINDLDKDFINNNITIVNQFPYLFNSSIKENFRIINPNISDDEIMILCEKVLLKKFLLSLPNGLDTIIGENGCQLSGGQRQKLCIARSLCKNGKILIFDEATSSLDNDSQKEIMQIIKEISKNITVLIIAHRLSTITYADSIILLKNGKIEAIDNHYNLLYNNDYYKKLYLADK